MPLGYPTIHLWKYKVNHSKMQILSWSSSRLKSFSESSPLQNEYLVYTTTKTSPGDWCRPRQNQNHAKKKKESEADNPNISKFLLQHIIVIWNVLAPAGIDQADPINLCMYFFIIEILLSFSLYHSLCLLYVLILYYLLNY